MKRIFLVCGFVIVMFSCSNKNESIISKSSSLFGIPTISNETYTYRSLNDTQMYKDFGTIKDYIDKTLDHTPTESKERLPLSDGSGLYTEYIWDTPSSHITLWQNYSDKDKFIQITVHEK